MARPRALKDILAGLALGAFGLAFAVVATSYQIGTTVAMGPGYFPLVLGGLLVLLGGVIVAKGFLDGEGGEVGAVSWRALGLILGAVLFFGLTVRGLGLVPATFVTALMSAFASRRTGVVGALAITVGLTVLCIVVFVLALSLRLPLVGPWIQS
jgi:Tripartite tricarboxylate transporter TctB family